MRLSIGTTDIPGERVQQVRSLSGSRSLHPMFPTRQNLLEILFGALHGHDVCADSLKFFPREFVHPLAWSTTSITCFQDLCQFPQGKSDTKGSLYHKHALHRALRIQPVARPRSQSSREHTDFLVVSDCVWTYSRRFRESAGMKTLGDIRSS